MENKEDLKLCYIQRLQHSKRGQHLFRFYFTEDIDDVVGESWELPAAGLCEPPYDDYVAFTYDLDSKKLDLELLEENDFFSYNDSTHNIVALAWEFEEDDQYSKKKLVFHFGETVKQVEDKLYERELADSITD